MDGAAEHSGDDLAAASGERGADVVGELAPAGARFHLIEVALGGLIGGEEASDIALGVFDGEIALQLIALAPLLVVFHAGQGLAVLKLGACGIQPVVMVGGPQFARGCLGLRAGVGVFDGLVERGLIFSECGIDGDAAIGQHAGGLGEACIRETFQLRARSQAWYAAIQNDKCWQSIAIYSTSRWGGFIRKAHAPNVLK